MSAAVIAFPAPARPRVENYGWLRAASQLQALALKAELEDVAAPGMPDRQAEILAALLRIERHLAQLAAH